MEVLTPEKDRKTDYFFVYFLENHLKDEKLSIKIDDKCIDASSLERVDKFTDEIILKDESYIISLYRFKIFQNKFEFNRKKQNNISITLILKDKENTIFESNIENLDFDKENYLYDVYFKENLGWTEITPPPKYLKLSFNTQFDYYINYIRNIKQKNQQT